MTCAVCRRVAVPPAVAALLEAGRRPIAIAAPLIALAAVRNRRWEIDIHVSRDVVFHSSTLIASGIFLLALAADRRGVPLRRNAEWGRVAEIALIFAGLVAVAVLLTSGSARSRMRAPLVDNFFSHRYDYRREWMRCIATLTAPDAFVALHKRAIRAVAEIVDSPAGRCSCARRRRRSNGPGLEHAGRPTPVSCPATRWCRFRDGDWIVRLDAFRTAHWFAVLPRTGWRCR